MKFKVIFNFLLYADRRGYVQKPSRTKPSRQKPPNKVPGHKPSRTIKREFAQRAFVRIFCTRPNKNGGGPRCVTYFWRVPGCATKCDRGKGAKLANGFSDYEHVLRRENHSLLP